MFFRNLTPEKKRLLLAVLITFSWTAAAELALAAWYCAYGYWYLAATGLFINGLTFLVVFRQTRAGADGQPERELGGRPVPE